MVTIDLYGVRITYDNGPIGMFLPDENGVYATLFPKYTAMDPVALEHSSRTKGRSAFVAELTQQLVWIRLEQNGYNPFFSPKDQKGGTYMHGLLNIPEEQKEGLRNAEAFIVEVLSALRGE